jgi:hypothetical protein
VFGLRVLSLLDYALVTAGGQRSALLAVGAAEALAVLAVAGPLARRAATMLRRLPPLPAASPRRPGSCPEQPTAPPLGGCAGAG